MATIYDIQGTMFWAYASGQSNWGPYIELTSVWDDGNLIRYNWEIGIWYKYNWSFNFTWEYRWGESGAGTETGASGSLSVDDGRTDGVERYVYTTGSDYWTRTNNDRSVYLQGYVSSNLGSGTADTGWFTIPKIASSDTPWSPTSYNVIYNPNGGVYNINNQFKVVGTNLTLNTETPTKSGFTFNGWNTKWDGSGTTYAAGATYTTDAPLYLFAQWTPNNLDTSIKTNKFITKEKFYRFITAVKSRLFPDNMADYIVDEGISKDNDHNWWWKWRHWNSGVSECWGLEYGQTTGYNTHFVAQIPSGIFIGAPALIAAMQINGMYGAWPNYHATDTNADGTTYIDGYLSCDTGTSGKNCWLRYYLRGVWK